MTDVPVSNKLWLISDTHFGHRNIVKFQQRPESHEAIMLSEWISAVGEDDPILHLGDVFPGGSPGRWAAILHRLPGRKYLILGNHDKSKRAVYERAGFTLVKPFIYHDIAFSHRPVTAAFPLWAEERQETTSFAANTRHSLGGNARFGWARNVHGHIHGNVLGSTRDKGYAATIAHDGQPFADKEYVNVCVEVTAFKPVRLGNVCAL